MIVIGNFWFLSTYRVSLSERWVNDSRHLVSKFNWQVQVQE